MATIQDQYDSAFLGILQNEGQISGFLDAIFAFLFRRTDFYVELQDKEGKMGFPPGVSEKLVQQAFKKYESAAKQRKALQQKKATSPKPAAVNKSIPSKPTQESTKTQTETKTVTSRPAEERLQPAEKKQESTGDSSKLSSNPLKSDPSPAENDATSKANEEDDDPELTRKQKEYQANPDSYNGAMRDNYSWSQSITDLDLKISVPASVRKGRDVSVDIQRKRLYVRRRDEVEGWCDLMQGDLAWEVNVEESMWSLEPGKSILVNLEKVQERWWECVLTNEPKINVRKIDPSRPMSDLDDEAQAKIEELMYNDHMKKLGKPQSHEKKVHNMLEKAWNADGSPFAGQAFDPSKLNISPEGTMTINP